MTKLFSFMSERLKLKSPFCILAPLLFIFSNCWSFIAKQYKEDFHIVNPPVKIHAYIERAGVGFVSFSPFIPIPVIPLYAFGGHGATERSLRACYDWCTEIFVSVGESDDLILLPDRTYLIDRNGQRIDQIQITSKHVLEEINTKGLASLKTGNFFRFKVQRDMYDLKSLRIKLRPKFGDPGSEIEISGDLKMYSNWGYGYLFLYAPIWWENWGELEYDTNSLKPVDP
jgi:hypothetical protein